MTACIASELPYAVARRLGAPVDNLYTDRSAENGDINRMDTAPTTGRGVAHHSISVLCVPCLAGFEGSVVDFSDLCPRVIYFGVTSWPALSLFQ